MRIWVPKSASMQKRMSPLKFAHLADKSGLNSVPNLSTKPKAAPRSIRRTCPARSPSGPPNRANRTSWGRSAPHLAQRASLPVAPQAFPRAGKMYPCTIAIIYHRPIFEGGFSAKDGKRFTQYLFLAEASADLWVRAK